MITREEALQTIHDCRITSLGELAHGYTVYEATANTLINQLFDQFESQLSSKPLKLTCETCNYFSWDGRGIGQCHNCSPQCPRYTLTDFGCIFHTKETK